MNKTEKPKRPLSTFNLFYKYKRAKILEARRKCDGNEYKEIIQQLVNAMPGLEPSLRTRQFGFRAS